MRRTTSIIAAAVLAIGGVSFMSQVRAEDPATPAPGDVNHVGTPTDATPAAPGNAVNTNTNGNNASATAPDADSIRKTIAKVTEDAVTKGDFNKLTKNFVDADYNKRVEDFKPSDNFAMLDGRIDQFRKDWKAKYNEDFGYTSQRSDVLNDQFARITQGEIGEARTAGGKEMPSAEPQNVKGGTPDDLKKSGVNQPDANSNKTFGGDTNREPGRNVASFILNGQAPMNASNMQANKETPVPMIHEVAEGWKIDIPDNLDGQKLHDSLFEAPDDG